MLQPEGYTLSFAEDGLEALQQCLSVPPRLIVVDHQLPKLSGVQLCKCLKEFPVTAEIPVIFVGDEDPKAMVQAMEAGGADYFTKPVEARMIQEQITTFLDYFVQVGQEVSIEADGLSGTGLVLNSSERLIKVECPEGSPLRRLEIGAGVEFSYKNERGTYRHKGAFLGAIEDTLLLAFSLWGGVYRNPNRVASQKELGMPLRYRIDQDFYRVGFASSLSCGELKIQNMTQFAKVGAPVLLELRLPAGDRPISVKGEIVRTQSTDKGLEAGVILRQTALENPLDLFRYIFGDLLETL